MLGFSIMVVSLFMTHSLAGIFFFCCQIDNKFQLLTIPYVPYFALHNVWLFPRQKTAFKGHNYQTFSALKNMLWPSWRIFQKSDSNSVLNGGNTDSQSILLRQERTLKAIGTISISVNTSLWGYSWNLTVVSCINMTGSCCF